MTDFWKSFTGYFTEDKRRIAVAPAMAAVILFAIHVVCMGFQAWYFLLTEGNEITATAFSTGSIPVYSAFVEFAIIPLVAVGMLGAIVFIAFALTIGPVIISELWKAGVEVLKP